MDCFGEQKAVLLHYRLKVETKLVDHQGFITAVRYTGQNYSSRYLKFPHMLSNLLFLNPMYKDGREN